MDEVAVVNPTVSQVENPDGSSNLDPITKAQKEKPEKNEEKQPSKPSKPLQIDVKKFALTDATIRKVKIYKGGDHPHVAQGPKSLTLLY